METILVETDSNRIMQCRAHSIPLLAADKCDNAERSHMSQVFNQIFQTPSLFCTATMFKNWYITLQGGHYGHYNFPTGHLVQPHSLAKSLQFFRVGSSFILTLPSQFDRCFKIYQIFLQCSNNFIFTALTVVIATLDL